jgi:hypothetical protein
MITPDWFVIEEMKMTDRENGGSLQFQMIIEKILYTTSDPQRTAKSININQNNQKFTLNIAFLGSLVINYSHGLWLKSSKARH